jgi:hypothetical protein
MYNVHMKRITPSEARRYWFRILDEVVAGEVVVIERNGARVTLRLEEAIGPGTGTTPPDYSRLLKVPDADRADAWGWQWNGPESEIEPRNGPGS